MQSSRSSPRGSARPFAKTARKINKKNKNKEIVIIRSAAVLRSPVVHKQSPCLVAHSNCFSNNNDMPSKSRERPRAFASTRRAQGELSELFPVVSRGKESLTLSLSQILHLPHRGKGEAGAYPVNSNARQQQRDRESPLRLSPGRVNATAILTFTGAR